MLLTDKFVYIHYPKTGGSFVTNRLFKLHDRTGYQNKHLRKIGKFLGNTGGGLIDTAKEGAQHNTCREIPFGFRGKPIVSTIRNPYDRYVSGYLYGWWKRYPEQFAGDVEAVVKAFPNYPNLSFDDYVRISNDFNAFRKIPTPDLDPGNPIGQRTYETINVFFKPSPDRVLSKIAEDYITSQNYQQDMYSVRFLRMENLNRELYEFLVEVGYPPEKAEFILESEKVLPGMQVGTIPREDKDWQDYYTPELKAFVRQRDRMFFQMFPEYDV
ncbi:MAG: sulfotransferase family 2 domain-containing protein [Geitlerinemataceae cyanobacterium]